MSRGWSVRGGIRAFLLGAEPRERDRSGGHRSWEGGTNTEEDDDGKDGPATGGGGAGRGSSTDTVRGPEDRTGATGWRRRLGEGKGGKKRRERERKIHKVEGLTV